MSNYSDQREEYQKQKNANVNANDTEIIKLILKMLVFNELIEKLVDWKKQENRQTESEVLKDLSFVPLMKCLYIVCLLSLKENENTPSLFDLFDQFIAYPKGPVDEDCYFYMDQLPEYTIRNNDGIEELAKKFSYRKDLSSRIDSLERTISSKNMSGTIDIDKDNQTILKQLMEGYEKYNSMLDTAVDIMKNASFFPGFREKGRLIDLTHMKVWEEAYSRQGSHEMDLDKRKLLEEAMFLKWNIAA